MYSDCHIHCRAGADGNEILRAMDAREMEKAVLIAPHMTKSDSEVVESIGLIEATCAPDPERLLGFAFVDPSLPGAVDHVRMAVDRGLKGFKLMPDHWYPYEERLFPTYAAIEEVRKPMLWHSGILWGNMDSSRFCQPVFYEVLIHFPKVKFALAHISWPWTDECLAVAGRIRAAARRDEGRQMQMFVDITRGTPDFYRVDALDKALKYLGAGQLVFGSDNTAPGDFAGSRRAVEADREIICSVLGRPEADFDRIARQNIEDWLSPMD
jgi:predicted TIM-barrel fold metal-dependent hydrolase